MISPDHYNNRFKGSNEMVKENNKIKPGSDLTNKKMVCNYYPKITEFKVIIFIGN